MSWWTRVSGIVSVYNLGHDLNFEDIFGKECNYSLEEWMHDPEKVDAAFEDYREHPEKYLPMGSEGSLHMSVWENPDLEDANAYVVSIFGNLRDWQYPEAIITWFQSKIGLILGKGCGIRSAIIEADNGIIYTEWSKRKVLFETEIEEENGYES